MPDMSPAEWEFVKGTFEAALALNESERADFIRQQCAGRGNLERMVQELVSSHTESSGFPGFSAAAEPPKPVFFEGQLAADRFRVLKLLSRGGMGEVYEVFDETLRLRVALKTLRPELLADASARSRFEREIRVARQVTHDSLCRVYDVFEHREEGRTVPCLTMQLLQGESLHAHLERLRPLRPDSALPLIRQIGAALEILHSHGIVHRDLKPSNVMLVPQANNGGTCAVLMDFGLAKPVDRLKEQFETQVDLQAGAPFFMAPELLRGDAPSLESDIFAFGLVVDEMVTERRPASNESIPSLYYQRLWGEPEPPANRAPGLPAHWNAAILGCLARDPSQRFHRASNFVAALEAESLAGAVSTAGDRPSGIKERRRPTRVLVRRRTLVAAFVLSLLTALGGLGAWISRPLKTSVVVFPIENLTARDEYNYLSKGMTVELTEGLMLLNGVRVIPYYEPRSKTTRPPPEARYLLSGYLQSTNNEVRLSIQLADNRDGSLLWTRKFDHSVTNPLQLQSHMTEGVLNAIEASALFGSPGRENGAGGLASVGIPLRRAFFQQPSRRPATSDPVAQELYLRGLDLWDERTVPTALQAIRLYNEALTRDPNFGLAYSALADARLVLMDYSYAPLAQLMAEARRDAERAVSLAPDSAEPHLSLAAVQQMLWDWSGSERSYLRALNANPRSARAHRWYGGLLIQFGRFEEGLRESRRALELDPYDYPNHSGHGLYLFFAERYDEAVQELESSLAQKDFLGSHINLGDTYAKLAALSSGRKSMEYLAKALREAGIVAQREMDSRRGDYGTHSLVRSNAMYALYYSVGGEHRKAAPYIRELQRSIGAGEASPMAMAEVFTVLGRTREALETIRMCLERRDRQLLYVKVSPFLIPLRPMPEFQSIIRTLQL
jgi:serine/threonine protein kinase/tetratricopeptide (TPR) repeat protein